MLYPWLVLVLKGTRAWSCQEASSTARGPPALRQGLGGVALLLVLKWVSLSTGGGGG